VVFIGGGDGKVYALDARTGAVVWTASTSSSFNCQTLVAGGMVYVTDALGLGLYQIDAVTGKIKEQVNTGSQSPVPAAVANDVLYIGNGNGALFAYGIPGENELWHYTAPSGKPVSAGPVVSGGVALIICSDNTLYAIGTRTGALLWSRSGIPAGTSYLAASGGLVYAYGAVSGRNVLTALDARTGRVRWQSAAGGTIDLIQMAVAGGIVYAGGGGSITGYRLRTGIKASGFDFDGSASGLAASGDLVYFGDSPGNSLHAVRV
jgi:outer membrane protein assembly factor BamB